MAVDFYLKLDNIQGESQVAAFKNQIQLSAFGFGGSNASSVSTNSGSGAGKVNLNALNVTKQPDSATVALFMAMCKGTHIATGTLSVVKSGAPGPYITLQMTEIFITAQQTNAGSEIPTESVSMTYRSIQYSYFEQTAQGNLVAKAVGGWDLARNSAL